MTAALERFKTAQADPNDGFETALAEMRAGRKRSHWIWYVFPQLSGLGISHESRFYGLDGVEEATAYLCDPELLGRLLTISTVVAGHLTGPTPARLTTLMGSGIDAQKLVSSMTLFSAVARRLFEAEGVAEHGAMAKVADAILAAAAVQGFPACGYTLGRLPSGAS